MTILGFLALLGVILTSISSAGRVISSDPKWKEGHDKKRKEGK